ncbi:FeoB-associated Cys-rich membrane protein [Cellulosimicrobium funkei]|nr:FeoB-associated Cys-rich membrane protein [Cellulosimicrobium funkei]
MEFLIALVIIAAVVFAIVRMRKTFGREIDRAKRIKRANDDQ